MSIHSCSYFCIRPECIKAQRDELREKLVGAVDCRLCAKFTTQTGGCISIVQCVNADQFKPTSPRRYWEVKSLLTPA